MDDADTAPALPWNTPPSGLGSTPCEWCGRTIYAPAWPCSERPLADIELLVTAPGLGHRCLYEMRTRKLL